MWCDGNAEEGKKGKYFGYEMELGILEQLSSMKIFVMSKFEVFFYICSFRSLEINLDNSYIFFGRA